MKKIIKTNELKRIFCVGPVGVLITVAVWFSAFGLEKTLSIPSMKIHPIFSFILLAVFSIDAVYLIAGSHKALKIKDRGKKLIMDGPFGYIRHPLYSAFIYSVTGILALWKQSWLLLISALPLSLIWSWLVQKEEQYLLKIFGEKYKNYQKRTGQFLPIWKTMKEDSESA